jgi:hypothetical protein
MNFAARLIKLIKSLHEKSLINPKQASERMPRERDQLKGHPPIERLSKQAPNQPQTPLTCALAKPIRITDFVIDQGHSDRASCRERLIKRGFSRERQRQPELLSFLFHFC